MEINGGKIITNELSKNAMGGTELMAHRMVRDLPPELLQNVQIIHSRVRTLDESKVRILVCHDLPGDPECNHLANGGWAKFHKIVFVSNWQMQNFINAYSIPWSKCQVIKNGIEPLSKNNLHWAELDQTDTNKVETVRLIYHTTPHRGLEILLPVFDELSKELDYITLDVYSSFGVYGWADSDKQFQRLFDFCHEHPKINYHGAVSNDEVRDALIDKHIYAYPSIWPETSCLSMMEAMMFGLLVVHPNLGALFETGGEQTLMYQWHEDKQEHSKIFKNKLEYAILNIKNYDFYSLKDRAVGPMEIGGYAYENFNWEDRQKEWTKLLHSLKDVDTKLEAPPQEMFVYRTN